MKSRESFRKLAVYLGLAVTIGIAGVANAISIAGYTFDDNAFADSLISSSGSFSVSGGTLEDVLTDSALDTYAFTVDSGAYVELGFDDNILVNGAGADLALFELGVADTFGISLTIGGVTQNYTSFDTGFDAAGFSVNVALVDLDDFGLGAGANLSSIVIAMDIVTPGSGTRPSLAVVGALNSLDSSPPIPEPASLLLLGGGLVGLVARRKKFLA